MSERRADSTPGGPPAPTVTPGELISAISALLLLIVMFAVRWYAVDGVPARASSPDAVVSAQNAWEALTLLRWLMLVTIIAAFAVVAIHARRASRVVVAASRLALLALATLTAAGVIVRVLIDLPSPDRIVDQKVGAVIGVIASLGIAFGAYESVREQRARLVGYASRLPAGP